MKKITFLLLIIFATYNAYSQSSSEFSASVYYLFLEASTNEEYKNLISRYSDIIDKDPKNSQILTLRGKTRYKLQDYENALVDFNVAYEIDSKEELSLLIGRTEAIRR